jgi:hypothetical protein
MNEPDLVGIPDFPGPKPLDELIECCECPPGWLGADVFCCVDACAGRTMRRLRIQMLRRMLCAAPCGTPLVCV